MRFISHRGNISGKITQKENTIPYITDALDNGFDVEIDVWLVDNKWYLGHDYIIDEINIDFLKSDKLLCHAKNKEALGEMIHHKDIHCFWHQEDTYTLTSRGIPIIYPDKPLIRGGIAMVRNNDFYDLNDLRNCYGICYDNIYYYKTLLK